MMRTQIQFEKGQYERIRQLAHRKRISFAEAVRRLVKLGLKSGLDQEERPGPKALLEVAGIASSQTPDLGRRHDHYLDEDLDD